MLPPAIELCHFAVSNGGVRDYVMRFPDGLDLSPTSIDGLRPTHRLECAIAVCGEWGGTRCCRHRPRSGGFSHRAASRADKDADGASRNRPRRGGRARRARASRSGRWPRAVSFRGWSTGWPGRRCGLTPRPQQHAKHEHRQSHHEHHHPGSTEHGVPFGSPETERVDDDGSPND